VLQKRHLGWILSAGWLFCSSCTIGMAGRRLFPVLFYLKKSNNSKQNRDGPDAWVSVGGLSGYLT